MKLKKKIRKRLTRPVRKLVERHGTEVAVKLLTGLVTAAAGAAIQKKKERRRSVAGGLKRKRGMRIAPPAGFAVSR